MIRLARVDKYVKLEPANGSYYDKKGYLFTKGWETSMAKTELVSKGWKPVPNSGGWSIFLKDRTIIYVLNVEGWCDYEE